MKKSKRTKRSKRIRLLLLGGLSAGAMAGCSPTRPPAISTDDVYGNNYYVAGIGYYHAPFRAWYEYPYNYYDARKRLFYFGGQWSPAPNISITNLSSPTQPTVRTAEANRTDVARGGFGCNGGHYSYFGG